MPNPFFQAHPRSSPKSGEPVRGSLLINRRGAVWLLLGLWALFAMPGCGGCVKSQAKIDREAKRKKLEAEEKKKKAKEKPKPDFVPGRALMTQPNSLSLVETSFKPGHWTSATLDLTANNFDFRGELVTDPFELTDMPFRLGTSRPANLPKAQRKSLELIYFVPPGKLNKRVIVRLLAPGGRREVLQESYPTVRIPDHQFYFLVLSSAPSRYNYLRSLNTVSPFCGWAPGQPFQHYYKIVSPKIDKRVPVPANSLCWTGVAYVLWDDFDPTLFTPEQQSAMLDWLHWGGRLVISGPDSLDALRTSFLAPFLPALGGDSLVLDTEALAPLSQSWSRKPGDSLKLKKNWSGRKLFVDPADPLVQVLARSPTEEPLLVERRVGRGGIVLSAFGLGSRDLVNWGGLDEFVHACLLRRQPRDFLFDENRGHYLRWDGVPGSMFDPTMVSDVDYFTRDDTVQRDSMYWQAVMENRPLGGIPLAPGPRREVFDPNDPDNESWASETLAPESDNANYGPGVAGWTDFNLPAELARRSLRQAAGIAIPNADFVVWVLGSYLLVLVPLNWAIFRLMGRVELAWVAAPVITIGFALAVVKLAQLDIGFARAKTELAVVEFNGAHPKAHVTRYTALYTSLSTRYDFRFDDATALVQPFPPFNKDEAQGLLQGQLRTTVNFRRFPSGDSESGTHITLEGFEVSSNSLGMLHSEHMSDMGGIILSGDRATGYKVANKTDLSLRGASVIGPGEVAWIGDLAAGGEAALTFEEGGLEALWSDNRAAAWRRQPGQERHKLLEVRDLGRLAHARNNGRELRLVAWTEEEVTGMTVEPAASQGTQSAVIIAHLAYGHRPLPEQDKRPFDVARADADNFDKKMGHELRTTVPGFPDSPEEEGIDGLPAGDDGTVDPGLDALKPADPGGS
ncbi:MAG: hypothetical protein AB7O62_21080 [Pirellulales bacterium]